MSEIPKKKSRFRKKTTKKASAKSSPAELNERIDQVVKDLDTLKESIVDENRSADESTKQANIDSLNRQIITKETELGRLQSELDAASPTAVKESTEQQLVVPTLEPEHSVNPDPDNVPSSSAEAAQSSVEPIESVDNTQVIDRQKDVATDETVVVAAAKEEHAIKEFAIQETDGDAPVDNTPSDMPELEPIPTSQEQPPLSEPERMPAAAAAAAADDDDVAEDPPDESDALLPSHQPSSIQGPGPGQAPPTDEPVANSTNDTPVSRGDAPGQGEDVEDTCMKSLLRRCVDRDWWWKVGHRMSDFHREVSFEVANPELDLKRDAHGIGVSVNVKETRSLWIQQVGLIKPVVIVHAVSIDTGLYIKSKKLPPSLPIFTKSCNLKEFDSIPYWDQDLIIHAYFSDVADENTILLMEMVDDKPMLDKVAGKTGKSAQGLESTSHQGKRVAWAYLLPIGHNGELNVGFSKEWTQTPMASTPHDDKGDTGDRTDKDDRTDKSRKKGTNENENESENDDQLSVATTENGENGYDEVTKAKPPASHTHISSTDRAPGIKRADKAVRLQLFKFRKHSGLVGLLQRKLMGWPWYSNYAELDVERYTADNVPEVYVQWRMQSKKPIAASFLAVTVGPCRGDQVRSTMNQGGGAVPLDAGMAAGVMDAATGEQLQGAELESSIASMEGALLGQYRFNRRGSVTSATVGASGGVSEKSKIDLAKAKAAVLRRSRLPGEACVVPDRLLHRYEVGSGGAMVVSFSHHGHLLAVATPSSAPTALSLSSQIVYSIKLFDTDYNEEVYCFDAAHHGAVYELKWSKYDRYLMSCSGDGTTKVWDLLSLAPYLHIILTAAKGGGDKGEVDATLASVSLTSLAITPPRMVQCVVGQLCSPVYTTVFQELGTIGGSTLQANIGQISVVDAQERMKTMEMSAVPRIITGSADGRLRVWESGKHLGYISVPMERDGIEDVSGYDNDFPPHSAQVNCVAVDERSRYLLSADAAGDILAWRCDIKGWYQILRKFKREPNPNHAISSATNAARDANGGVLSLSLHPDKNKGQMLVMTKRPNDLKIINMATYKVQSFCAGFGGVTAPSAGAVFSRAGLSADGRFIVCGSTANSSSTTTNKSRQSFRLCFWDTQTGHIARPSPSSSASTPNPTSSSSSSSSSSSGLSDILLPYPIRAIAWHPRQHLIAVAMIGPQASVALYCAHRDNVQLALNMKSVASTGQLGGDAPLRQSHSSLPPSAANSPAKGRKATHTQATTFSPLGTMSSISELEGVGYRELDSPAPSKKAASSLSQPTTNVPPHLAEKAKGLMSRIKAAGL